MRLVERITSLLSNTKGKLFYFAVGIAATSPLDYVYHGNPIYHISGAISGVISRVIDHASTIPLIRLHNTEEFKRSNLGKRYYETNPFTGKHPTLKQYILRSIPQDIFVILAATGYPGAGYTYLTTLSFIVPHHKKVKRELERELEEIRTT